LPTEGVYSRDMVRGNSREGGGGGVSAARRGRSSPWRSGGVWGGVGRGGERLLEAELRLELLLLGQPRRRDQRHGARLRRPLPGRRDLAGAAAASRSARRAAARRRARIALGPSRRCWARAYGRGGCAGAGWRREERPERGDLGGQRARTSFLRTRERRRTRRASQTVVLERSRYSSTRACTRAPGGPRQPLRLAG
jgi:hypothetical protein